MELRKRMGAIGKKRVEEHLAWEYSESSLIAAYERAFEKQSGRPSAATKSSVSVESDSAN